MSHVRSTVKAIVLHEGKVLLNRCRDARNGDYDSLPGGGQEQYETMADAVRRECLEETGYTVEPVRFAALMEEICLDPFIRETYPQYAHKMLHIFVCRLVSTERIAPTETDDLQIAVEWVPLEEVPKLNLLPVQVKERFSELTEGDRPLYLGSVYLEYNHG
ncbi:MAG: NUDIX domain-containing protein [Clostridiales bacterium]|nr:NUDIX domain-containing protein [Clostridiales bacterium]